MDERKEREREREREREKGMKRKLTDDGRGRYCPCSGTGDAGPGGGPRALLASATNSWHFCLLSVRRLKRKGREGKGRGERERESCGEPAEKGRKLGIFVSPWLSIPPLLPLLRFLFLFLRCLLARFRRCPLLFLSLSVFLSVCPSVHCC
jgi:hypothetical protein